MYPSPFEYFAPATLPEAQSLMRQHGQDAKVLAGGHSLIPMMRLRLAEPKYLIDLGRIPDLSYVREQIDGGVLIGAMTSYYQIETSDFLRSNYRALVEATSQVADMQVRNKGTIGGSLAHADPGADLPAVIVALGGQMRSGMSAELRTVDADRFFAGPFTTELRYNEVLAEIRIPGLPPNTGSAYRKFANRASHFAIVGVAAFVTMSGGVCQRARIGITGAGPNAVRATAAEEALEGVQLTEDALVEASRRAADGIDYLGDIHASADYRAHLTQVFTRRALDEAISRAG